VGAPFGVPRVLRAQMRVVWFSFQQASLAFVLLLSLLVCFQTMSPTPVAAQSGHPSEYERVLRALGASSSPGAQEPLVDIVICVLNENNGPLYGMPPAPP